MGLDMYLEAKKYAFNMDDKTKSEIKKAIKINKFDLNTISLEVAYWRKANAIHKWFVDNVQDGKDDCEEYYVSREQLTVLKELCEKVLKTATTVPSEVVNGYSIAVNNENQIEETPNLEVGKLVTNPADCSELLPTQDGFFFGGTDYDQYYLDDIEDTIKQLEEILTSEELDGWYFSYRSSW